MDDIKANRRTKKQQTFDMYSNVKYDASCLEFIFALNQIPAYALLWTCVLLENKLGNFKAKIIVLL